MPQKWIYHIVAWSIFLLFRSIDIFEDSSVDGADVLLSMTVPLITILIFYIYYFQVWPRFLNKKYFGLLFILVPLGILGFMGLRYLLEEKVYLWLFGFDNNNDQLEVFQYYFNDNYFRILPFLGISGLLYVFEKRVEEDQIKIRLEQEKLAAELNLLRSQLNPHFLFNTLSYLYTEAYQVDEKLAGKMLTLSNILRYAMNSSKKETQSLEEEIKLLEDYIQIFQSRFEGQCFIQFDHQLEHPNLQIEPLLFISFLENAFKHGVFNDPEHPIQVQLKEENRKVQFYCQNRINTYQKDPGSGIGLANVEKRLALKYSAETYSLKLGSTNDTFSVNLNIQL
jgi:hypothetical protein